MSSRGTTFMGFGIRIDIMSQAAIFAFKQLTTTALVFVGTITQVADELIKFHKVMADLSRLMVLSAGTTANLEARMASLGSEILTLSTDSIFGFEAVAGALSYLMRAGFDSAGAMEQLAKSMQLATAVGMELTEATRTLVRLENMFKYAGQDVVNIVDQLAQSEMLFAMTTEQMNTALNMSGAIAAEAGISLAQLATMIGVLYSAGINASTAGTVLRRSLAAVLDISGPAGDSIAGLGVDMDYFSSLVPLDRLRLLAEYITAIEDPQTRLTAAFEIFGIRGVNILPVLESLVTDFDGLANSIQTAEGVAKMAADTFMNQLHTKMVMLGQEIQNLIVTFGIWTTDSAQNAMAVAVALTGVIFALTWKTVGLTIATKAATIASAFNYVAKLREAIASWHVTGANVMETTSIWTKVTAIWAETKARGKGILVTIKEMIGKLISGTTNIAVALTYGILTIAIKLATFATKAFFKALGPIGLVLSLLGAIIMVVKDEFGDFGGLLDEFKPIMNQLTDFFKFFGMIIMEIAVAIMPLVSMALKMLMVQLKFVLFPLKILMMVFKMIMPIFKYLAILIGNISQQFSDWIENTGIMTKLMEALEWVMKGVMKVVTFVLNAFIALANAIIWIINLGKEVGDEGYIKPLEKVDAETMLAEVSADVPKDDVIPPYVYDPDEGDTGPGTTPSPPSASDVPTGSSNENVRSGGSGGKAGGGYSFLLNIYIIPEMSEFWDAAQFGESLVEGLALEIKRSSGVYLS